MTVDFNIKDFVENNPKLVTRKESKRYPGLFVLKYHRKVFYNAWWTPELQEFRGMVVDADYNIIVHPFTKVFNRGEMGTDLPLDEPVTYVEKINGFMAAVTMTDEYGAVISTTGSLDSDFVDMARQHLRGHGVWGYGLTYIFEIVDTRDPHIIPEMEGAYLIGVRELNSGLMMTESALDDIAKAKNFFRPRWNRGKFADVLKMSKEATHEGFMVYGASGTTLKLKSPYYLVKKLLARLTEKRFTNNWLDTQQMREIVDEEYYPLLDHIRENRDKFQAMDEQDRLVFMRQFLHGGFGIF